MFGDDFSAVVAALETLRLAVQLLLSDERQFEVSLFVVIHSVVLVPYYYKYLIVMF
jgi:hypothetical protein